MLAEAPRYRYTGQGVEWPQGCLQWALYPIVTQAISRTLFIWPSYCAVCQYNLGCHQTSVDAAMCVQLLACFGAHLSEALFGEGRKPSQLLSIARDWWLPWALPHMPISHSFSCAPPFIPIQIPTVTVMQCRCWRSGLFLVVLKVSCNSKLPRLTFRQLLLYLSSIWICCGHWETSLRWMEQRVCLGSYDFVCSKWFEYSKSQHPACSCQISKEKKNHPEILRLMKSPKFIQW